MVEKLQTSYAYKNKLLTRLKDIIRYIENQYNISIKFINIFPSFSKQIGDLNKKDKELYTEEEFKVFISNASNELESIIFYTLFYTGLRLGELRALTWNDINLNNNSIRVNKQVTNKIPGKGPTLITTKSESSNRNKKIPNVLVSRLKSWYNNRSTIIDFKENWIVFGDDQYLNENKIRRMSKRISNLANLPYLNPHSFRHSYITILFNKGMNPKIIQSQVGHSSITIKLDVYTHIEEEEMKKNVIDLFEKDQN